MKRFARGFTVVEVMVGAAILMLTFLAAAAVMAPLNQSFRRLRMQSAMQKIESSIRNAIFYQGNYQNASTVSVRIGGVLVATSGQDVFVSDKLETSSVAGRGAIRVRFEMANYTSGGRNFLGGIYQISSTDPKLVTRPLGIGVWPTEQIPARTVAQLIATEGPLNFQSDLTPTIISVPSSFTQKITQKCTNGFLRGLKPDGVTAECWSYDVAQCPAWQIPSGYVLDDATGKISVKCEKLNQVSCPALEITLRSGTKVNLPNFTVLSKLNLHDLYPPRAAQAVSLSKCTPIVNFFKYSPNGDISPQDAINRSPASTPNVCPDQRLYTRLVTNGPCLLNFDPLSVNPIIDGSVVPQ